MHAILPYDSSILLLFAGLILAYVLIGFTITRITSYVPAISMAWLLLLIFTISIERISFDEPPAFRMLSIIFIMLLGMKAIVTIEYYKNRENKLNLRRWMAFSLGWFGMRPGLFEELGKRSLSGGKELVLSGTYRVIAGLVLIFIAHRISVSFFGYEYKIMVTAIGLAGISLVLHFGILNISAGIWRFSGADTHTLFKEPLISTSLTEFWGKRWNMAFSEMTAIALYKPLKGYLGITAATIIAFLYSGLLHELAISVPVMKGYGLPMIYFFIHGALILIEKKLAQNGMAINKNKVLGRIWVYFWLIIPMPLLFHKTFIKDVVWPILQVYQY